MERLFKLKGASVDHEDLVDLFPAGSATVKKIDQEYYLQIPESDSSQDDTVESVGGRLPQVLCGTRHDNQVDGLRHKASKEVKQSRLNYLQWNAEFPPSCPGQTQYDEAESRSS
jgi:hypothetical protein